MTRPTPNTSSAGSGGCSRGDRFGKHFKKCRNGRIKSEVLSNLVSQEETLQVTSSKDIVLTS